ncbi:hypothetical protein [Halomicronema sp. CCY15110]|uniref:hypothetical protein n=1 Tax=Halomicronema sp. CCY15110 TaxID=2767773 RepID=UPI00194E788B|nr:hypothetical protein [Halomicronema sp. CCY15110]
MHESPQFQPVCPTRCGVAAAATAWVRLATASEAVSLLIKSRSRAMDDRRAIAPRLTPNRQPPAAQAADRPDDWLHAAIAIKLAELQTTGYAGEMKQTKWLPAPRPLIAVAPQNADSGQFSTCDDQRKNIGSCLLSRRSWMSRI